MSDMLNERDVLNEIEMTVAKGNQLIQRSRFSLSLLEQKALLFLISKIKPYDEPRTAYEFNMRDFCKVCNIDIKSSGTYYEYVKQMMLKIRSSELVLEYPNGDTLITGWFLKARLKRNGIFEVVFDEELTPYLFNLQNLYTSYSLSYVLAMKSKYGIRLYELLKSYKNIRYRQRYTLDELRDRLGCENYTEYSDFRKYVLQPAMKDINEVSDLQVEFVALKTGRKVSHIEFTISYMDGWENRNRMNERMERLGIDFHL